MATLSPARASVPLLPGLSLVNRGKVRDTYDLGSNLLLIVCTDGVSIFDFVLNALVPEKGTILTAMTHFWLTMLEEHGIRTHMVAAGAAIDEYLPAELQNNQLLQSRAMVVRRLVMTPVEFIGRTCLTGSGLGEYVHTGSVCGVKLPAGLQDGDELPYILGTPTTKAEEGHDEPLPADEIRRQYPEQTQLLSQILQIGGGYARKRGILLADSKLEFGVNEENGQVTLGDEALTPDSSRFWGVAEWRQSRKPQVGRKAPTPFDKQFVREFGLLRGVNKLDPKNPTDVALVHGLKVPEYVVDITTQTYRYIFWRLTGLTVEDYFEQKLGVVLPRKQKRIALVFGSQSDIPVAGLLTPEMLGGAGVLVNIISCHRNPSEVDEFAQDLQDVDVVIAAGGLAFALPGVLDAWLHKWQKCIPVVGVAFGQEGSQELLAAQLSISQLPGQPVVMDEMTGEVYSGREGFREALARVLCGELPPPKARKDRQAYMGLNVEEYNELAEGRVL